MRFGLVGYPIAHSLSPQLHSAGFTKLGLNHSYEIIPTRDIYQAWPLLIEGFVGLNITIPHKQTVLNLSDEVSPEVKAIGAANTILFSDGRALAFNTDAQGFIKSLDFNVSNKKAVIFGAGGASRAIIWGLIEAGISSVSVVNRENRELPFGLKVYPYTDTELISSADILINATPVDPPVDLAKTKESAIVIDLRYTDTGFLSRAKSLNRKTVDGKGMLAYQAALAWEIWFGFFGPVSTFHEVLGRDI